MGSDDPRLAPVCRQARGRPQGDRRRRCVPAAACSVNVRGPKVNRLNFILFITDQHRADFLGCYGHPVVKTPHIDSIASRGTAFDKFYVASPVCMPNRASLMTGRMPSV